MTETTAIGQLKKRAFWEFQDVSDFVWKAPRLIDSERIRETKKLDAYFPDDTEHRRLRHARESQKLDATFPYMIATGNLFSTISLFESYMLLLGGELQSKTGRRLDEVKGQGLSKLLAYFKLCGALPGSIPYHEQMLAAIRIRNSLMHASGLLSWSRDETELRRLFKSSSFLALEDRERRKKVAEPMDLVNIVPSPLGDRLVVQNIYAHLLCGYLVEYFVQLCEQCDRL